MMMIMKEKRVGERRRERDANAEVESRKLGWAVGGRPSTRHREGKVRSI